MLTHGVLMSNATGVDITSNIQSIISAVTAQFSVANITTVIAAVIAGGIGFVFLWWGVRKAYRFLMGAVKSGRSRGV